MDTFDAIEQRRAIKQFDPDHRLSETEETRLLSAALLSPTAFNIQHWRLAAVRDPALRQRIRAHAWDQAQVTDASLLLVLCADLNAWDKDPARYWRNASDDVRDFMVPAIDGYYRDRDQVQRDEAMRSCGIVAQTLMLGAKSMGYDSCPMDGFDFEAVGALIHLPDDHVIAMMLAIGRATAPAWPRGGQLALAQVVVENTFA